MKRLIKTALMTFFAVCSVTAQEIARVEYKEFDSQLFPFKRPVLIYTPEAYDDGTENDYDVIYVFDSQARTNFDMVQSLLHYALQQPHNDRGYIVVGVANPSHWEIDYQRSNDFLPDPQHWKIESPYHGSVDKFKKFLKEELMPYIDSNYRTSGHTAGIGHSLGASFVIDAMTTDDMFDDIIAISPNMVWDDDYYANMIKNFDFAGSRPRFIALTMGKEGLDTDTLYQFPKNWRDSWNNTKAFLDSITIPEHITLKVLDFPDYDHYEVVLQSHLNALKYYANYRYTPVFMDDMLYPVHIELAGSTVDGDVYITGNQPALGNWNPEGVKMQVLNDTTRVININLRLPAEFKFTKGSWDYQYFIKNGDPGNQRIASPRKAVKHYKTH
ncbi:MAG: hypothetical protein K2M16_05890 [Muribaculaceae bacterium]|nr:hypothetical protein [Muribaculaceae bacterium]